MNNYIYSELSNENRFICDLSGIYNNKLYKSEALIDTGCYFNLFPLRTLGVSPDEIIMDKRYFILNSYKWEILRGVEDSYHYTRADIERMSLQEKMNCKALVFHTKLSNLILNDCKIGSGAIRVNCDTNGSILIGMGLLKYFDFHIGKSKKNGKNVFIACVKKHITSDYLNALEEHFGLYSKGKVLQVAIDAKEIAVQESGVRDVAAAFDDYFSRNLKGV